MRKIIREPKPPTTVVEPMSEQKHSEEPAKETTEEWAERWGVPVRAKRPWKVGKTDRGHGHGDFGVLDADGNLVAKIVSVLSAHDDAFDIVDSVNALAGINPEAVPELLAACREALPFVCIATTEHANANERGRHNAQLCVKQIQAALAKAETP